MEVSLDRLLQIIGEQQVELLELRKQVASMREALMTFQKQATPESTVP